MKIDAQEDSCWSQPKNRLVERKHVIVTNACGCLQFPSMTKHAKSSQGSSIRCKMASSKSSTTDKPMLIHIHPQCGACNTLLLPEDRIVACIVFRLSSPTSSNTNINIECFTLRIPFKRTIRLPRVTAAITLRDPFFAMSLQTNVATLPRKA